MIVGPGADNANVLYQRIQVEPLIPIKIVARANSFGLRESTGRLQVNWLDVGDRFISSSSVLIKVGGDEKPFEAFITAPNNALFGILYVTPHGPKDAVQFSEMRAFASHKN